MSWQSRHAAITAQLDHLQAAGHVRWWLRESSTAGPWWNVTTTANPLSHGYTTVEVEELIAKLATADKVYEQLAIV